MFKLDNQEFDMRKALLFIFAESSSSTQCGVSFYLI